MHVLWAGTVIASVAWCIVFQGLFALMVVANEITIANIEVIVAGIAESFDVFALEVDADELPLAKLEFIVAFIAATAE